MRLHLEITGKCNLRCKYCYNAQYNKPEFFSCEIPPDRWMHIIEEANSLECQRFTISGGEPFLVPKLPEIVAKCQSPVIIFTNGQFLTPEIIHELSAIPQLLGLRISMDGIKAHDKYRVGSRSVDIVPRIELLRDSRLTVGITTMVSQDLLFELIEFYELLKSLSIEHWRIDLPFFSGRYHENANYFNQGSFRELVIAFRGLISRYIHDGKPFHLGITNIYKSQIVDVSYGKFDTCIHPCSYEDVVCIKANGDITVCSAYSLVLGNINDFGTLSEALEHIRSNKFYSMRIKDIEECLGCRYLKLCGGGCRADSFYLMGSDLLPDPICCSLWALVEQEIIPIIPSQEGLCLTRLIDANGSAPQAFEHIDHILANK